MDLCRYCQIAIVEPARALLDPDGFLLDPACAAELARGGDLSQVQLPIVRAGALVDYLPAFWSAHLERFVTIPESKERPMLPSGFQEKLTPELALHYAAVAGLWLALRRIEVVFSHPDRQVVVQWAEAQGR